MVLVKKVECANRCFLSLSFFLGTASRFVMGGRLPITTSIFLLLLSLCIRRLWLVVVVAFSPTPSILRVGPKSQRIKDGSYNSAMEGERRECAVFFLVVATSNAQPSLDLRQVQKCRLAHAQGQFASSVDKINFYDARGVKDFFLA